MSAVELQDAARLLRELAEKSNAWPFEEARKVVARLNKRPKDLVIFETGYGPSGLPHIGTFGEVARTTMVRHAFRVLTEDKIKTRLIAFSDDMDGLRKVPDNIPDKDMVARHLGMPLTRVPDPFGTHPSFGEHNNARLRAFLDAFGFDYEFLSSTECYLSGRFDAALLTVLERFDLVMNIMLPSLREERAQTYSPFLPICPRTGVVLQVPIVARDVEAGAISYDDPETGERMTTPVTGGRCKLQWKPDWAMRWVALGVDYEMAGKDLIDSVKLSGAICRALGGAPPEGFNYELFLDEDGQKISKSKGNGLTIDEWLRYASPESLSLFMYREPKAAKRLYFDVIPRHVDEYQQNLEAYARQDARARLANPVWHIHAGDPPAADVPISFTMLLNLVSASNAENAETLWGFIGRYWPGVTKESHPKLRALVEYAIHYFRDFVLPAKRFREPTDPERAALLDLRDALSQLPEDAPAEKIQEVVYEVGRREPFLDTSGKSKAKDGKPGVSLDWFNMLYQVLLGQEKGPRFGSFVAIYGLKNTIDMIDGALARSADSKAESQEEPQLPPWLRATPADLETFDFEVPIATSKSADSNELSHLYRAAASTAGETDTAAGRVYTMLSAVTGMLFKPQDRNEPFGHMVAFSDGRRSAIPTDFRGSHVDTLAAMAERAKHPTLRARLSDLCWLLDRKRAQLGTKAAGAYVEIVEKVDQGELAFQFDEGRSALTHDTRDLLRRALQIGRAIGWEKKEAVVARALVSKLRTRAIQNTLPIPVYWFNELDLEFSVSDPAVVGTDIEGLMVRLPAGGDPDNCVELWRLAARAYHIAKNNDAKYSCLSEAAEQLVSMAEGQGSAMLASTMLSEAIAELHGVPGKKDRRRELRHRLVDVQAEIFEEMSVFSHPMDLNEIVKQTEQSLDRPTLLEKLFVFAALARSPEPAELIKEASETIKNHPLSSLFAASHHDREGKVIHRTEGSDFGGRGDASAIQRQIAQDEGIRRNVIVSGQIEVARNAIVRQHFVSDDLFSFLLKYCAFVPPHLRATFSRGFVRFFHGDYVSALYILTPLLEDSLRHVLKVRGHDVTVFDDATQTQQDRTISSLYEQMRSELDGVFGQAITTDIENIFLRKPGPALRHAVAHGLLSDGDPYGHDAIYGCWLIFHLCLLPLFPYHTQLRLPFE